MQLKIEFRTYPNGESYGVFYLGRHEIGKADQKENGWLLRGSRKVSPCEISAAKAMIDRMIRKARNDAAHARNMMEELRKHRWRTNKESVRAVPPLAGGEESINTHAGQS